MMSGIRGIDTRPERKIRRLLHAAGYRFRLHASLPGRPDIVLRRHRIAIFVHGCFWHRHQACRYSTIPSSNSEFWREKLARNVARDIANERLLLEAGWRVLVVWECAIRDRKARADRLSDRIIGWVASKRKRGEIPRRPSP
jgi:DNA mismatch endonuclease, patch repair protein